MPQPLIIFLSIGFRLKRKRKQQFSSQFKYRITHFVYSSAYLKCCKVQALFCLIKVSGKKYVLFEKRKVDNLR